MVKNMKTLNASKVLKNYGTLIGYILVLIAFTILAPGRFMTPQNMIGILRQIAMLGTISIGLTFVMITKRSDLSIGYSTSFLGIFVAALLVHAEHLAGGHFNCGAGRPDRPHQWYDYRLPGRA